MDVELCRAGAYPRWECSPGKVTTQRFPGRTSLQQELSAALRDFSIPPSTQFSVSDARKAPARTGSHRGPGRAPVLRTNERQGEKNEPNPEGALQGLGGFRGAGTARELTEPRAPCRDRSLPWGGNERRGQRPAPRSPRGWANTGPDTPGPGTGQTPGPRTQQTAAPALGKHRTHPAPSRRGSGSAAQPGPTPPGTRGLRPGRCRQRRPRSRPRSQPRSRPRSGPAALTCW